MSSNPSGETCPSEYLNSFEKRALDLTIACSLGSAMLAGCAGAATAIAAANKTNPVFRQARPGRGGEDFNIFKLKTMDSEGNLLRLGNLSRKGIDETPQILNVLSGEMSVVGYRPVLAEDLNHAIQRMRAHYLDSSLSSIEQWVDLRKETKPGITGPAQTMPFRPDAGSIEHLGEVIGEECDYMEYATLSTDLTLIAKTPVALSRGRNPAIQRAPDSHDFGEA